MSRVVVVGGGIIGRVGRIVAGPPWCRGRPCSTPARPARGRRRRTLGTWCPATSSRSRRPAWSAPGSGRWPAATGRSRSTRACAASWRPGWRSSPRRAPRRTCAAGRPPSSGCWEPRWTEVDRLLAAGVELDHARDGLIQVFTRPESLEAARHEAAHMRELGLPRRGDAAGRPARRRAAGARRRRRDPADPRRPAQPGPAARRPCAPRRSPTGPSSAPPPSPASPPDRPRSSPTDGPIPADQVVLAAGVWTPELAATVPTADGWSPGCRSCPRRATASQSRMCPRYPTGRCCSWTSASRSRPWATGLRITGRFELTDPSDRGDPRPAHRRAAQRGPRGTGSARRRPGHPALERSAPGHPRRPADDRPDRPRFAGRRRLRPWDARHHDRPGHRRAGRGDGRR